MQKCGITFPIRNRKVYNTQTSQEYIFHSLQHFCMLFPAVLKKFPILKVYLEGNRSIKVAQ